MITQSKPRANGRKPRPPGVESRKRTGGTAVAGDSSEWGRPQSESARAAAAAPGPAAPERVEHAMLPIAAIGPSPYQPRQSFAEDEIQALADSIRQHGLLQPIAVRRRRSEGGDRSSERGDRRSEADLRSPISDLPSYELLDGERRWRSAKLVGLKEIRAEIQPCSDARARAIVIASALQRKDLNAIEQAHGFRQILDAGDAAGPTELAKILGLSQGHVSNALRLLELPEAWQRRIISGEISAAHGRELLRWKETPYVLESLAGAFKERFEGSAEQFAEEIDSHLMQHSEVLGGEHYDARTRSSAPCFKPTAEERASLKIFEMPSRWDKKRTREFCLNIKLFEKLQAAHAKNWAKQREASEEKSGKPKAGSGKGKAKAAPARPPTKAEVEALNRHEAQRAAEQARLTARKVWDWRIDRLREAAAGVLKDDRTPQDRRLRVFLYFMVASEAWEFAGSAAFRHKHDREELLEFASRSRCEEKQPLAKHPWKAIEAIEATAIAARLLGTAAELLWSSQHGPQVPMRDDAVEAIAKHLGVDLAGLWPADRTGSWGRKYFELHTREQLCALGDETGRYLPPMTDKAGMVRMLSGDHPLKFPKELAKAKRV